MPKFRQILPSGHADHMINGFYICMFPDNICQQVVLAVFISQIVHFLPALPHQPFSVKQKLDQIVAECTGFKNPSISSGAANPSVPIQFPDT